ncbi:MAG: hypothetical protein Fur0012_05340 [Elusimicrobiota bacterium]
MRKIILAAVAAGILSGFLFAGGENAQEWKERKFTSSELKKYDGTNGMPVYVAVDGVVYDLSNSKYWKTGLHMKQHRAGTDLSEDIKNKAPQSIHHGGKILEGMPKVGMLVYEAKKQIEDKAAETAAEKVRNEKMAEFFSDKTEKGEKEPIFVWFGAAAILCLFVTIFLGFNIGRYGFKIHRFFAMLTGILALLHLVFGAWLSLF